MYTWLRLSLISFIWHTLLRNLMKTVQIRVLQQGSRPLSGGTGQTQPLPEEQQLGQDRRGLPHLPHTYQQLQRRLSQGTGHLQAAPVGVACNQGVWPVVKDCVVYTTCIIIHVLFCTYKMFRLCSFCIVCYWHMCLYSKGQLAAFIVSVNCTCAFIPVSQWTTFKPRLARRSLRQR